MLDRSAEFEPMAMQDRQTSCSLRLFMNGNLLWPKLHVVLSYGCLGVLSIGNLFAHSLFLNASKFRLMPKS